MHIDGREKGSNFYGASEEKHRQTVQEQRPYAGMQGWWYKCCPLSLFPGNAAASGKWSDSTTSCSLIKSFTKAFMGVTQTC